MRSRSPILRTEHSAGRFPSPGSVRHKFVREDVPERRYTYDARSQVQQSSPQSPNARPGTRNNLDRQRSPVSRRYSENHQNWAQNAGSPNTPRERLAQRPDVLATERGHTVKGTIDYNGLRDVPTGPRLKNNDPIAWSPPSDYHGIRDVPTGPRLKNNDHVAWSPPRPPWIFISFQYLPNQPASTKHLSRLLGKDLGPRAITRDGDGWILAYEDSPAGLERLVQCFERFNNELLFNQYKLCMQCHTYGRQPRSQKDMENYNDGGTNDTNALHVPNRRFENSVVPSSAGFKGRQLTYQEPIKSLESKVDAVSITEKADTTAHTLDNALSDSLFMTRTNELHLMGTNTSLQSLRSDRDETGSLGSGVTRSDSSRVKRNRCHRCKGEAVPGSSILVRCSTCPRQYHRRCHLDPAIPVDLTDTHDWICASCAKKGRAGKETPREDNPNPPSRIQAHILETESSVPKNAPEEQQATENNDHGPAAMVTNDASDAQFQLLRSDSKSPQHEIQPQGDLTTNNNPGAMDEHAPLSDADDLVAKSFAAGEVQTHSKPRAQNPGKLKITRTKLPPKLPSMSAQRSQSESQPDHSGPSAAESPTATLSEIGTKAASMNRVVARNSAADFRALAHERHQTAIKNGADGHSVSEEQRSSHNAPETTPRSSLAHQSLEEPQPHQPSTFGPSFAVPTLAKPVTEREIPESPDEVRRGEVSSKNPVINPRIQALLPPAGVASMPPPRRTSNVIHTQYDKSPALMRPRAPSAVVRCHNCQKLTPKGPTGKNKLCSGCKRDKAAAAGLNVPEDANGAPRIPITPLHTSFAPVANMGTSPSTVVAPAEPGPRSEQVIETNKQKQDPPVTSNVLKHVACNTCYKRHTKCTHNEPVAQASMQSSLNQQGGDAAGADKPTRKTTASDVDHASHVQQTTHLAPDEGHVHNVLAAEILGELRFAPTAQMLLREEPPTTETKIRQLLKILDENVTARMDMSVLKRLIFIHSEVGDSGWRPTGARLKLVAMALGSAASRRMQSQDIKDWIADTIPGYKKGEGNWAARITSELSQDKLVSSGSGYWREEEWQDGDGGKPKGKWYHLLPEKEDELWTWCPVLKEPLSPSARLETQKTGKSGLRRAPTSARASTASSTSGPVTPISSTKEAVSIYCGSFVRGEDSKCLDATGADLAGDASMGADALMVEGPAQSPRGLKRKHHSRLNGLFISENSEFSSSEDEPLSAVKKGRRGETLPQDPSHCPAVQQSPPAGKDVNDQMDLEPGMSTTNSSKPGDSIDGGHDGVSKASGASGDRKKSRVVTLYLNGSRRSSNAETSDRYVLAKHEQTATSLYDEWPEFRQHASDEHDKLAEIQQRPRKKQLFGKSTSHPQTLCEKDAPAQPAITSDPSPGKRSRRTMVDPRPDEPYPWENPHNDPTRKEFTSLEELFDFPDSMIPIISEGQLAYRDGKRTDDGRLPRAREIFKI